MRLSNSLVEQSRFLLLGKIVGTHGLKGNIKVHSFAETPAIFKPGSRILVKSTRNREKAYEIRWARPHTQKILLSLNGIDDRSVAESLIGSELFIEKAALPELEDDSFYWYDIIGLLVYTTEDVYLGKVESIIATGSNDVYVVKDPDKEQDNEILVPALESVVVEIDLNRGVMRVVLPDGL